MATLWTSTFRNASYTSHVPTIKLLKHKSTNPQLYQTWDKEIIKPTFNPLEIIITSNIAFTLKKHLKLFLHFTLIFHAP